MLAALKPQFWWYLARASGIVAWVLLALAVVWGLLVASRMTSTTAGRSAACALRMAPRL